MTATAFPGSWTDADVDPVAVWRDSGAEWLTARGAAVPAHLVRGVVGVVERLDDAGAGLGATTVGRGVGLLAERAALVGFGPSGRVSCGGGTHLLDAADATVAVTLARDGDIELIPAWLELDGVTAGDHWQVVAAELARRRAAEVVERAALLGLACSMLGERSGAPPVLVERIVERPAAAVRDCVVVDLASLWAGPLAADVLARLGARVITVESTHRPDGSRATGAFFHHLHHRTDSVALDLRADDGRRRLAALVSHADVVIEGSRPRALAQLGIDAAEVVRRGCRVWLSITGHGRHGDAGARIGFGDDAAVAGGLVTSGPDGRPVLVADAVADPVTGLVAAASVVDLLEAGGGVVADVALSRVASRWAPAPGDERPAPSGAPGRPRVVTPAPEAARSELGADTGRVLAEFGID